MDNMNDIAFGNRLKYLREARKLTQPKLAELVGMSYSAIQKHEAGSGVNKTTLNRYVIFYKCDRSWLLTGQGEPFMVEVLRDESLNIVTDKGTPIYRHTQDFGVPCEAISAEQAAARKADAARNAALDSFAESISGLREIYNSGDVLLIQAIEVNIRAFRQEAHREKIIREQALKINRLEKEMKDLKDQLSEHIAQGNDYSGRFSREK
jgi:transcriptional regulator with XRE-family HTH domain